MDVRSMLPAVATAAGVAMALSGCGMPGIPIGHERGADAAPASSIDCLSEPSSRLEDPQATETPAPHPEPGRVPDGFEPAAALLCELPTSSADATEDTLAVTRFDGDLGPLLHALDAPDDVAGPGLMCTADMELVPSLWLEAEDGTLIPVHWPRDVCGKTKPGVGRQLEKLKPGATIEVPLS
jgi:hypothetical protein